MLPHTLRLLLAFTFAGALNLPLLAKDKPEAILAAAKKPSDTQAWSVQAHVNADKSMKVSGIISGKDFDLTIETLDGFTRQIALGEKSWTTEDGGKTWKSASTVDRRFYFLVHTPIKPSPDEKIPPFEAVGTEKVGSESLLHIRFIAPDKEQYVGDRPNYWIAVDGKPPVIHRYYGPAAFENNYINERVEYAAVTGKNPILAPPGNPQAVPPPAGPERLLMTAMKKMTSGVWEVKGTSVFKKTITLHGLLEGENFDMTMEPGVQPDTPMREIMIGDKAWICSDGKTWHSGVAEDRLVYNITHTPILYGRLEPPFEKLGSEERDGATWLHIRLKVDDAKVDPKDLPQYWLVLDAQGEALYIGRAELPMISRGTTDVSRSSFDYAPAKGRIAPPPASAMKEPAPAAAKGDALTAPVDDAIHGFQDIETHKADWAGKIVHVEVTPKLLQALEVTKGTFRVMLKDTTESAITYGQVDFPGDALVSLGFLKIAVPGNHSWGELQDMKALGRTEGAPVSFYVRVVNLGAKPAARCIAVGSKYSPGSDGPGKYTW